jgi:hypothetical protein
MNLQKATGASGISFEHIQSWHFKARISDATCRKAIKIWDKILRLINIAFIFGQVPSSFYSGIEVIIPKPKNQVFCAVALLEIYKLLSTIINN